MNPEVYLTKLSVNDDIALDRAAVAHLESVLGCEFTDGAKKELTEYVEGMNNYYGSDVFAIDIPGKELSSGLVTVCFDGDEITIEDLFVREVVRKRGIGRAAIEALASEYPDARVIELYSLQSAEGFYQKIGFECVAPATNKCLSLWRKELN
ncbi:GNAT family N-acetyltransferase [Candidatus Minimicrobia naudis]|uniref:GNAT family N-acetyltransferase n=1 Tax=Candidatus Minimicrobia naudis TaxID=2841263 RepID=A0A8F1MBD9_9BACT|nr:GNAT family N-acetyltransferase [Candidatus Minimicrobia naudis]